jgi:uncharacterized protein YjbJ (UPF0337 family)
MARITAIDKEYMSTMAKDISQIEPENPNVRQQNDEWRKQRVQRGQDPNDAEAFRQHVQAIGAPDPGQEKIADPKGAAAREAAGTKNEAVGSLKKVAGKVLGNEQMAAEGEAQRQTGKVDRAADS